MTTYNTGNPLGSSDPRDLYDNAENLDNFVNGAQPAYDDRLGKSRKSWQGMEDEFAAFIAAGGYVGTGTDGAVEDYAAGIEITGYNQIVRDALGEFWRLSGSVDLPYTTTGAGLPEGGNFVAVGDAALRQELDTNTAGQGSDLIAHTGTPQTVTEALNDRVIYVGSVAELVGITGPVNGSRYQVTGFHAGNDFGGGEFYYAASQSKTSHNGVTVIDPDKTLPLDWSNETQVSEWFSPQVSGNGCYVRINNSGASLYISGALEGSSAQALTLALQAGIDALSDYVFPENFDATISTSGLDLRSNQTVTMPATCTIRMETNSLGEYQIIRAHGIQNTRIYGQGASLVGDLDTHTGTTGEAGMGLSIRHCAGLYAEGLKISKCWGDGVYISYLNNANIGLISENIELRKMHCFENRRQGLSLISCRNFYAYDCDFDDTSGTEPEAGVDIEPNNPEDVLENIVFDFCRSKGNASGGFILVLDKLDENSRPVSITFNQCFSGAGNLYGYFFQGVGTAGVPGFIELTDCTSFEAVRSGIYSRYWDAAGPKIRFIRPKIVNPNAGASNDIHLGSAIVWRRRITDTAMTGRPHGGVTFENAEISDTRAVPLMRRGFVFEDEGENLLREIRVIDPVGMYGIDASNYIYLIGRAHITDNNGVLIQNFTASSPVTFQISNSFASRFTNSGSTAQINIDLPPAQLLAHSEITIYADSAQIVRVRVQDSNDSILPYGVTGQWTQSGGTIGESITVRSDGGNWIVVNRVGSWSVGP